MGFVGLLLTVIGIAGIWSINGTLEDTQVEIRNVKEALEALMEEDAE